MTILVLCTKSYRQAIAPLHPNHGTQTEELLVPILSRSWPEVARGPAGEILSEKVAVPTDEPNNFSPSFAEKGGT